MIRMRSIVGIYLTALLVLAIWAVWFAYTVY